MNAKEGQFKTGRGKSGKTPKPISGVLSRVIGSLGIARNYNGWLVVTRWPQIVGRQIADRARAVSYEDGFLYVAVKDSSWRQELSMRQDELLEKIRNYPYGKSVKEIRLVQGRKGSE